MDYIFKGKWIGTSMTIEDRRAPVFKKTFTIEKEIEKAELEPGTHRGAGALCPATAGGIGGCVPGCAL